MLSFKVSFVCWETRNRLTRSKVLLLGALAQCALALVADVPGLNGTLIRAVSEVDEAHDI